LRVEVSGVRFQVSGFRVEDFRVRVYDVGFRISVYDIGFKV